MEHSKAKILLIDDHAIVVEGIATLLKQSGFSSVTVETNCEKGLQYALENNPDLIIVDISMPGIGGLGLIRRLKKKNLNIKTIVFSMHDDPSIVLRAMDSDAKGYVSKTSSPDKIFDAIDAVMSGGIYLSEDIAQLLAFDKLNPSNNILNRLSPKEYEIFEMLVNGNSVSQIAKTLYLSPKSVSNYVTKIKTKLDVSSMVELMHIGFKHHIPA